MNFERRVHMAKARAESMVREPDHYNDEDRAWLASPTTQALLANDRVTWTKLWYETPAAAEE